MAFEYALSFLFLADGHRVSSKSSFVSPALVRVSLPKRGEHGSVREREESRMPSEFLWPPNMIENERMAAWMTRFLFTCSRFGGLTSRFPGIYSCSVFAYISCIKSLPHSSRRLCLCVREEVRLLRKS